MLRLELAKKLIAAESAAERTQLLTANKKLADERLALEIKNICYDAWASTPTTARKAAAALKSLYKFAPQKETEGFLLWVSGISDLTAGKLESAIGNLNGAGKMFRELHFEHRSAQARVAALMALALLGRYDEAVVTGESILKVLDKYGDDPAAGRTEMNLGNIVSRRDLHLKAEKYYLSARKRFIRAGDKSSLVMAENGLAITYTQLNDFRKAGKFFANALKIAHRGKMLLTEAELEASIGSLALLRGRYDEALKFLELSRRKYEELNMPHQTAVAGLEIADIYRELNLTDEALDIYIAVSEKFKKLKLQGEEARARANLGRIAATRGETPVARSNLKKSARLYELEKNKTGAAAVKLEEARLELEQNNIEKARVILSEAEKLLRASESFRNKLIAKLLKAEAFVREGNIAGAEKSLSGILAEANKQEQPSIALAALNSLGDLARGKGDIVKAKQYFKKAVGLVEKLRSPLAGEEFRMAFLANKLGPFENLTAIYLAENKLPEAFSYVERARSRALAEMLNGEAQEFSVSHIPAELKRKLLSLREELNWYYSRLSRAADKDIAKFQQEAKQREKQIARLMRQIESTYNRDAANKSKIIDLPLLQRQLGKEKLLIEFVNIDGVFSAFIVDDKKIRYVNDLATGKEILALLEGLQFQFGALRYGTKMPERFMAELKRRADLYLQRLYEKLLQPLENYFSSRDLVIVPAGPLYYVPFQALRNGEKHLIENREISYSPSAAIWQALQQKPALKIKNAMLMGFADESIPLVNDEIRNLKKIFPAAKSFTGKNASFSAYTRNAPGFDLLHLACHGQFRPENPMFSSLHLADGWVTVRDICAQKLTAQIVTLSACETGLNRIFAGDELIGLARGFLSAGVSSLILSLWTVNDKATAGLMKSLYKNIQRGHTVPASLKIAQNEFIRRGEHPYFWSPFALIGR